MITSLRPPSPAFTHSTLAISLNSSFFPRCPALASFRTAPKTSAPHRRRCTMPVNSKASTTPSASPVEPSRVSMLKVGVEPPQGHATHVLYWMSTSLRTRHNPALEHAAHLSNRLRLPLRVAHLLHSFDADGEALPERHAVFQLQGVRDVTAALRARHIPFIVIRPTENGGHSSALADLKRLAHGAASLVTDADYLRPGRRLCARLSRALDIPCYVVEANVVVPLAEASNKAEHAARTIRPKITRLLPDYITEPSSVDLQYQSSEDDWPLNAERSTQASPDDDDNDSSNDEEDDDISERRVRVESDADIEAALTAWSGLDRDAPRVSTFPGGERAAQLRLNKFLDEQLAQYATARNEPALQATSDMSVYLRAGNISPVDVALRVRERATTANKASRESFLEEMIVRRELAANACYFNADGYDKYEGVVPRFAQESLALHAADKRPVVYSYEELEAGLTNDVFWNCAQLELVVRGKMHGYMRMYWAKQVIGWIEKPEQALAFTTRLNNRWALDAIDPNSYVGVNWCYGLHDQGWRERPIWGKVRYMNEAGLRRKFNMPAYIAMVQRLVRSDGLPTHIDALRKERKASLGVQTSIADTLKRKSAKSRAKTKSDGERQSSRPAKRSKF